MTEKVDYYDIFSTFVLGTLLLSGVLILFPSVSSINIPQYPEAFVVVALTALTIFLGQLVQAIASMCEPLLFWTFCGRPSERALTKGLGILFPPDTVERIKKKLREAVGSQANTQSLFLFAIQCSNAAGAGRVARFNSMYAYHRGLVVLLVVLLALFLASTVWGSATALSTLQAVLVFVLLSVTLVITWYRSKQRSFFYVREVLLTTERVLDEKAITSGTPTHHVSQ